MRFWSSTSFSDLRSVLPLQPEGSEGVFGCHDRIEVIRKDLLLSLDCKELLVENIPSMEMKVKLLKSVLLAKGLAKVSA